MESGSMTEAPIDEQDGGQIQLTTAKKLIFGSIATVLGLLALEGAGRLVGYPTGAVRTLSKIGAMDQETFDSSVGMWRPGFTGRVSWPVEIAYDVSINKLGFRGPELNFEKQPGSFRILCLGDSTTFCVYVKEGKTYPEILQQQLRKDFPKVEVINGGHPAWGTSDQLRFLKERAIKMKPDLIIHLFCGNDPTDIVDPDGQNGNYAQKLTTIDKGISLSDSLRFHTAIGEMETRIHIFWKQWRGKNRKQSFTPYGITEEQWALYRKTYKKLADYCEEQSVALVTACFPAMKEAAKAEQRLEYKVTKIAEANRIPVIPLAGAFRAAEARDQKLYWMPVDTHANEKGCELIALELAQALKARRLGPYDQK
jgi:lysophospholipase L1-like esterase